MSFSAPLRRVSGGVRDFDQMPVVSLTCGTGIYIRDHRAVKLCSLPVFSSLAYLPVVAVYATFAAGTLCAASHLLFRDQGAAVKFPPRRLWQRVVPVPGEFSP